MRCWKLRVSLGWSGQHALRISIQLSMPGICLADELPPGQYLQQPFQSWKSLFWMSGTTSPKNSSIIWLTLCHAGARLCWLFEVIIRPIKEQSVLLPCLFVSSSRGAHITVLFHEPCEQGFPCLNTSVCPIFLVYLNAFLLVWVKHRLIHTIS